MRSAIIYYSFSGNTKKVADILAGHLAQNSEVQVVALKAQDESGNFFSQCLRALRRKQAKIEPVGFDLKGFDLICLGTPVWAFGPAPAINAFLEQCQGLEKKQVVLFTTYGSGTGKGRCIDYMQKALAEKGAKDFKRFSIQQARAGDKEFVLSKIHETMRLWPRTKIPGA
jgi:flavodoxin